MCADGVGRGGLNREDERRRRPGPDTDVRADGGAGRRVLRIGEPGGLARALFDDDLGAGLDEFGRRFRNERDAAFALGTFLQDDDSHGASLSVRNGDCVAGVAPRYGLDAADCLSRALRHAGRSTAAPFRPPTQRHWLRKPGSASRKNASSA